MTKDCTTAGEVILTGALTMRTTVATCAQLREAMAQQAELSIDCHAATEVDLTFVQLLVAAGTSARLLNKPIGLAGRPEGALLDVLTRAGFRVISIHQPSTASTSTVPAFWFEEVSA